MNVDVNHAVCNTKKMMGTFNPRDEPYTFELEEGTTPSGFFARGPFLVRSKVFFSSFFFFKDGRGGGGDSFDFLYMKNGVFVWFDLTFLVYVFAVCG